MARVTQKEYGFKQIHISLESEKELGIMFRVLQQAEVMIDRDSTNTRGWLNGITANLARYVSNDLFGEVKDKYTLQSPAKIDHDIDDK